MVKSDREMMSLVWNNLFSNAIKFTEKGGCVSLSLTAENDNAVVTITDTGCGISKEVGTHIFDKFYQATLLTLHKATAWDLRLSNALLILRGVKYLFRARWVKAAHLR